MQAGGNLVKPGDVAGNVSGDKRYGNERGLHVDSMVVRGPVPAKPDRLPGSHRRIVFRDPEFGDDSRLDCGRQVIARFAERAFRRPSSRTSWSGSSSSTGWPWTGARVTNAPLQVALTTVLASPRFLFLVEPEESREDRPLTEYELASRLSYFLWSSMPDDELFREARAGTLRANLRRQVTRMLADPRSDEFVANFAGQWLQLRKLVGTARDKDLFKDFDDALRDAMRRETERFFAYILREDRSVLELLDSDYTFVNEALARHYGIEGVRGEAFRKVALTDRRRGAC